MKPAPPVIRKVFTGCPTLPYGPEGNQRSLVAAIEEQIDGRQVRDELAVQLGVGRMRVVLPLDHDAVLPEQLDVEIRGGGIARHLGRSAKPGADIPQARAAVAADVERG